MIRNAFHCTIFLIVCIQLIGQILSEEEIFGIRTIPDEIMEIQPREHARRTSTMGKVKAGLNQMVKKVTGKMRTTKDNQKHKQKKNKHATRSIPDHHMIFINSVEEFKNKCSGISANAIPVCTSDKYCFCLEGSNLKFQAKIEKIPDPTLFHQPHGTLKYSENTTGLSMTAIEVY